MPSVYVHLSGRDIDDALLGVYGLKENAEAQKPYLTPRICPRCGTSNIVDAKFCSKCGLALDVKAAAQLEEARAKMDNMMDALMNDKEFSARLHAGNEQNGKTAGASWIVVSDGCPIMEE